MTMRSYDDIGETGSHGHCLCVTVGFSKVEKEKATDRKALSVATRLLTA